MKRLLPSGAVTFMFTDVEGSTKLLHELGSDNYAEALAEHRRIVRETFSRHGGVEVDTQGDAFFVAFPESAGALAAAAAATDALRGGPIRVRIGIHTGTPLLTADGYVGPDVHRAARIAAAGHGGQVLVSKDTCELVEGTFTDLGEHRLKDIAGPVSIFQLGSERFPPLNTVANTNLPSPVSEFVGRETELHELSSLLRDGVRLVTLTGAGGSGKTRLAVEAARQLVPHFKAGVFWVELAPITDPALVTEAVARTLGAKATLADHIGERELLLLVDNVEHVIGAAPELASLVEECPNLRVMVTSRELLRVRGEREFAVPPLAESEAVRLFCTRSGVASDGSVRDLCRALDNMPLAIELAASRARILSAKEILDRLSAPLARLDLLKGGRDADPRQQTLRATIEWSHDLLAPAEQHLFARLSIFAGGCTLEAAEVIAEADLDRIQSLVDKSLVRHSDGRFWMLESIRAYAAERLDHSGATEEVRRRHARYYVEFARRMDALISSGEPEEGPVFLLEQEINNFRAAVDLSLQTGRSDVVSEITAALLMYWVVRGLYPEARSWVDRALTFDDAQDDVRRRLLSALATVAYAQGDHATAVDAADAAASLAAQLGGASQEMASLRERAVAARLNGDYERAERLFRERLDLAIAVGNGVAESSCRLNLAYIANKTRRHDAAQTLLAENLPFVRSKGQVRCEANTLALIAETKLYQRDEGTEDAMLAATLAFQISDKPLTLNALELLAASEGLRGDTRFAAMILAATESEREKAQLAPDEDEAAVRTMALDSLGSDRSALADAWENGRRLEIPAALALARDHVAHARVDRAPPHFAEPGAVGRNTHGGPDVT
ncbi:MAG: adenylate/guanylate cyclase domain-containing protein [Chloroflexota bacterium]